MTADTPLMVRYFDTGGYYETRVLLCLAAMVFVTVLWRRGDTRYAIAFISGAVFHALLEWWLQSEGLRGPFGMSLFGQSLTGPLANSAQGLLEGGPLAVMGFWFATLFMERSAVTPDRRIYLLALLVVILLALGVIPFARDEQVTSARPMVWQDLLFPSITLAAFLLALATRGRQGLKMLAPCVLGVALYAVATFESLHVAGLRTIGYRRSEGLLAAPFADQLLRMSNSLLIEVALFKSYNFALPIALGILRVRPNRLAVPR